MKLKNKSIHGEDMNVKVTLRKLEREYRNVSKVVGLLSEEDRRGVIMLACAAYGFDAVTLANELQGYDRSEIVDTLRRLRRNGILRQGKLNVDWFGKCGGLAFLLDVMVINGLLVRSRAGKKGTR